MRLMKPYAGENIAESCRRAYFELMKGNEPIILYFNDTTVLFTNDRGGFHHKDHDIDTVELEYILGMSTKELYDSSKQSTRRDCDDTHTK